MMLMNLTPYELSKLLIVGQQLSQKTYKNYCSYVFIKFFSCVMLKEYNERVFIFFVVANLAMGFLERSSWRTKFFYLKRGNNLFTSKFVSWWFDPQVLHEVQGLILKSNSNLISNESHILFFFPLDWYLWLTRLVNFHPCGFKNLVIYFHLIRKISGI